MLYRVAASLERWLPNMWNLPSPAPSLIRLLHTYHTGNHHTFLPTQRHLERRTLKYQFSKPPTNSFTYWTPSSSFYKKPSYPNIHQEDILMSYYVLLLSIFPYTPSRGCLMTVIHTSIQFLGNITKIPYTLSAYLQIIPTKNAPPNPYIVFHMYMPTHSLEIYCLSP